VSGSKEETKEYGYWPWQPQRRRAQTFQRQTKMMGKNRWTRRSKASGKFMPQKKAGSKEV
jgi:hypothetical protein